MQSWKYPNRQGDKRRQLRLTKKCANRISNNNQTQGLNHAPTTRVSPNRGPIDLRNQDLGAQKAQTVPETRRMETTKYTEYPKPELQVPRKLQGSAVPEEAVIVQTAEYITANGFRSRRGYRVQLRQSV
ncbi:uncharacterized protein N7479_009342 [Penicillium vulpinum]|uniref:uncharacterized protein n=1 Tax=Penicillium vulpinum TaxID=29845 RepID=UPI0025481597|nr:uncharacterized protein N7479_009342 [Penicillium vulpinum]KAJ5950929.1 hypothetical protein N7479_009342 [Penicillium vulpinum]